MLRWIALQAGEGLSPRTLGWWALQFTPRVALVPQDDAVILEVHASLRLFGGPEGLCRQLEQGARALGVRFGATASTAAAALARLRHAGEPWFDGWGRPLPAVLDALPLAVIPAVQQQAATLSPLGCQSLGDVRRLPRAGLARRVGQAPLLALDQAYGQHPESFEWLQLPELFEARLELPWRVEHTPALMDGARPLLVQLCAWLAGRQAGVTHFTLGWQHDLHRRDERREGQLSVRLAEPSRDLERLVRLLTEHLHHVTLAGPVGELSLRADEVNPMALHSDALFQELGQESSPLPRLDDLRTPAGQRVQHRQWHALLERLAARLGSHRVLTGHLVADHRPERAQQWMPLEPGKSATPGSQGPVRPAWPQPCWLLPEPLRLGLSPSRPGQPDLMQGQPLYQGALRLLAGPHRVEAGWWDEDRQPAVARDYYLAHSPQAGLVWVYRERALGAQAVSPWFLHGLFA